VSGHAFLFEPGWGARFVCEEPIGADCRLEGPLNCYCESWTVARDDKGEPFHEITDWRGQVVERHWMHDREGCNVVEFLEEDPDDLFVGKPVRLPITVEWSSNDESYVWRLA
jgi:hypothetical protein